MDRRLGDYVLPPKWRIVAAGNPGSDRLIDALNNRFLHLHIKPTIQDWILWANVNNIEPEIISFLMAKPNLLLTMPAGDLINDEAYPTPRQWEYASRIHTTHQDSPVYRKVLGGTVGEAAILEFMGHVNMIKRLPTIAELIANPTSYNFNNSPSKVAALCLMVVHYADNTNINPIMDYVSTVPPEFQVLFVTMINDSKNKLMGTSIMTKWCLANPTIFG